MSESRPRADDLDAALRAFAAADAFERDAAELRAQLRRLRAAGRTAPPWSARWGRRAPLPAALPRIAAEAAFLIAAAVFVGVAGYRAVIVVLTMAAAWLVVLGIESALLRERRAKAHPLPGEPTPDAEAFLEALRPTAPPSRSSVPS
jgi:hypothetical protein